MTSFSSSSASDRDPLTALLQGVPPALLEAKRGLEEAMRGSIAPRAQALAAGEATGAANIQGVAIGFGEMTGRQSATAPRSGAPGDPVLAVFLAEPAPSVDVRSTMVEAFGVQAAASENDVPVHPVVTGYIDAQPNRLRLRPTPVGNSVGHYKITAGTLGFLAVGRSGDRASRLFIVGNNHVLANSNAASLGDPILQPGPYDGGTYPADQVAVLERFVPVQFGGATNYVDCATAWAWPDRVRPDLLQMTGGQPSYFRVASQPVDPQLGMTVGKSGRTTQVTSGRITALGASIWVNYAGGQSAYFEDQIAIEGLNGDFSAGGDSGSLIWTWDATRSPVGLLFAGGGAVTFANRLPRVLTALDVDLYT